MVLHVVTRHLVVEEVFVRHVGQLAHVSRLTQLGAVGAPAVPSEDVLVNVEITYVREGRRIGVRPQMARLTEGAQVLVTALMLARRALQCAKPRVLPLVVLRSQYSLDGVVMGFLA